ncbi:hypothetical protein Ate02nite_74720 [Paractinoplanes tereljensis]|uniref:Uncharacterized protein n=2 Tax=Paractinoplanes tereljensis TaxID=571912 RepID=A0A919TYB9_9ACTN|nr:hypothetical protein Ate02nite_74720 [Actinoplanes tereljensis]
MGYSMEQNWRHLPPPARPIAAAATDAVEAAQLRDSDALADAVARMAGLDPAHTGLILGVTVRLLLEDTQPDGIDAEGVRTVLERSVRGASEWQTEVDPHVILLLLAGALGVADEDDDTPPPKLDELARHAALLLADLLGPRPVPPFLTAALAEIERAQLND